MLYEVITDLERLFKLEKLNKAPAVFDYKKLEWYNGQYIRALSDEALAEAAMPYALSGALFGGEGAQASPAQNARFVAAMPLIKERLVFLSEVTEKLRYLFTTPAIPAAEEFIPKKLRNNFV